MSENNFIADKLLKAIQEEERDKTRGLSLIHIFKHLAEIDQACNERIEKHRFRYGKAGRRN